LLRSLAEGLAFLRTVDGAKPDALWVDVVQDFEGVAVEKINNLANSGGPGDAGRLQYCAGIEEG
jgi:hypothetical protein